MQKEDKERVVAELTERLRTAETLIVADYRGLTMPQIDGLRGKLLEHGARLSVVKNTLTRRAAEAAGADALLALLEGPSAIAFIESDGDPAAVAKALSDSARDTRILTIRGGVLNGRSITDADVESLAKLPPLDVLRGQVIGVILAPLTQLLGARERPAAEPDRADRRPHRSAEGAGRHRSGAEPARGGRASRRPRLRPRSRGGQPSGRAEPATRRPSRGEAAGRAAGEPEAEAAEETAEPEAAAEAPAKETDSETRRPDDGCS